MSELSNIWEDSWNTFEKDIGKATSKFRQEPVGAGEFFRDYLHTPLFPRQQRIVDAVFTGDFQNISTLKNEFYIGHGKRSGKDLTIANLLTYLVYWLLCLNDPQEYLGIKSGEPIDLVNVAFDKEQAESVFFEKFIRKIKGARNPVTRKNVFEEFGMNIDKSILKHSIEFPKNIRAWSLNSVSYKAEGKNTVFAVFDEIGSFRFDKAQAIHRHIRSTARTTALKHYKLFFISFLTSGSDYMAYLLEKAESQSNTTHFVDRAATWDVRSAKGCSKELLKYVIYKEDYQEDYDTDPTNAMLMYECKIPKYGANSFIKRPERIMECINIDRPSPRLENEYLWTLDIMKEEFESWFKPNYIWEIHILEKAYEKKPSEDIAEQIKVLKERHQYSSYSVHLDLSRGVVDAAGFSLGHTYYVLDKIKVYVDLMLQVKSTKLEDGTIKEIDLTTILNFVLWLKKEKKFPIKRLTADGWNSALFMDVCRKNNIDCEIVPLKNNPAPYETLKDFIYRQDIDLYYYSIAVRELKELIINDKKKIDHPTKSQWRMREEHLLKGSSDVSDCLALLAASAMKDVDGEPLAYSAK